jgi:hypothetical protein
MSGTAQLHFPKLVQWVPLEDITAYELATAVPVLFAMAHGKPTVADDVFNLPLGAQRHFKVSENPFNQMAGHAQE